MVVAVFPGSFDPVTNGHIDTVTRASRLFDQVVVAVTTNTAKHSLFTAEERVKMFTHAVADLPNVRVVNQPDMLTVAYAKQIGATVLIRGVRNTADFNFESDIAAMNNSLDERIETLLLFGDKRYRFISSSVIKEVARFGGPVTEFVPEEVSLALSQKFLESKNEKKSSI